MSNNNNMDQSSNSGRPISLLDVFNEEKEQKEYRLLAISFIIVVILVIVLIFNINSPIMPHVIISMTVVYWYVHSASYQGELTSLEAVSLILIVVYSIMSLAILLPILISSPPLYYWLSLVVPILSILIIIIGLSEFHGGKIVFWGLVSFDILCAGSLLVLLGYEIVFPEMVIEMAGAFVGLGSVISLGELLKALQIQRESKKLYRTLLEELDDILKDLRKNRAVDLANRDDIPYPMWHAALNTREILDINSDIRKKLTHVYYMVSKYNDANTDTRIDIAISAIEAFITSEEEEDTEMDENNGKSEFMNDTNREKA